jgi:hypothetical protein
MTKVNIEEMNDFIFHHDNGKIRKIKKEAFNFDIGIINEKIQELADYMEKYNLTELEFYCGFPAILRVIDGKYIAFSLDPMHSEERESTNNFLDKYEIKDN